MFTRRVNFKAEDAPRDGAEQLARCRQTINQAKQQIDNEVKRTSAKQWDYATNGMELSRHVALSLRGKYDIPRDASNAFFKCIELFNLLGPHLRASIIKNGGTLRMFDNASLPGDFIRAAEWWLSHRCNKGVHGETPVSTVLDWRANSLDGGLDDRFGLIRDHPERWMQLQVKGAWTAGTSAMIRHHYAAGRPKDLPANTELRKINGDVSDMTNRLDIAQHLDGEKWKADIYTSDLGFAVQSYYKEEEEHLEAHFGQCYLGMDVLRLGGAMIVKTFTMSHSRTMGMICHLGEHFDEFYIVKPETSKPDNSECYWVCLGYRGQIGTGVDSTHDPYVDRPVYYHKDVVAAQQQLAHRQSQKIMQNVLDYRIRSNFHRYSKQFAALVQRWCERHIGASTPSPSPSTPLLPPLPHSASPQGPPQAE